MSIDDVADTINLLILHRLTPAMHEQLSSCHIFTTNIIAIIELRH